MQNSPNPKLILIPCDHSQFRIFSNAKENEIHWGNIKISSCTPYQKSRHWRNSKIVHVLIVWSRQVLSRHFVQRPCFCRDVRTLYFLYMFMNDQRVTSHPGYPTFCLVTIVCVLSFSCDFSSLRQYRLPFERSWKCVLRTVIFLWISTVENSALRALSWWKIGTCRYSWTVL